MTSFAGAVRRLPRRVLAAALITAVAIPTAWSAYSSAQDGAHVHAAAGMADLSYDPGVMRSDACADGFALIDTAPGAPVECVHGDPVPPGLSTALPTTAQLLAKGTVTVDRIVRAAAQEGVATPAQMVTAATQGMTPCYDDGQSGHRVQTLYVVEQGQPDRFADLVDAIRAETAAIDLAYDRKAAVTGGVRHVRFVTEGAAVDGNCLINVQKVIVPAGALATFTGSINAVKNAGYNAAQRKYLLWADTAAGTQQGWCGIASVYGDTQPGQGNANNGAYPQYARAEAPCWIRADHSTMLHEFTHSLGSVAANAPHHSAAGHCTDESDVMCYDDGAGVQQVCPLSQEGELDCNADDYFNTNPQLGTYLANYWNTANSAFLASSGGSGSGGNPSMPRPLVPIVSVGANPPIPGLPTQASVVAAVPAGRSVATIKLAVTPKTCIAVRTDTPGADSDGREEALYTITCGAGSTGSMALTASMTDSTAVATSSKASFAFDTTPRAYTRTVTVMGRNPSADVCAISAPITARIVDSVTSLPVYGMSSTLTYTPSGGTAKATKATSGADGVTKWTAVLADSAAVSIAGPSTGVYTGAASTATVRTTTCSSPSLTADAPDLAAALPYGLGVVVSGDLTAAVGGVTVPVPGQAVAVRITAPGETKASVTATGTTGPDGSYAVSLPAKATGVVTVSTTAATALPAASATLDTAITSVANWSLAASQLAIAAPSDGNPKSAFTITGTVTKSGAGVTVPATGSKLKVYVLKADGSSVAGGTVTVGANGALNASVVPTVSGTLKLLLAATTGYNAAELTVGAVAPASTVTLKATAGTSRQVSVTATLTPVRTGTVTIQASTDGTTFTTLGTVTAGTASTFTLPSLGTWKLRAVFAGDSVGGPRTTSTVSVTLK